MIDKASELLQKAEQHLESEFSKLQVGRANPAVVEDVMVELYWSLEKIKNIAAISSLDSQTLNIKPWDRNAVHPIAKAITDSWIGLNPQTMADSIMIKFPPMTEERRKDTVKLAKNVLEDWKVTIRNIRWDVLKDIKKQETDKLISEDIRKDLEKKLQDIIDKYNKIFEEKFKKKETDLMRI